MSKDEVEQSLQQSWERVESVKLLRGIVEEIDRSVPGDRTKEMMYDLVDLVLSMGERVHDLELRLVSYGAQEHLQDQQERIRVDTKKDQTSNLYRQRRDVKRI